MPHCHHYRLSPGTNQVLCCWRSAAAVAPEATACREARRSDVPPNRKTVRTNTASQVTSVSFHTAFGARTQQIIRKPIENCHVLAPE